MTISKILAIAILSCLFSVTSPFAEPSSTDFDLQQTRTALERGISVPPSNPPTMNTDKQKALFLQEDFESTTFPPTGWDTLNLNDGYGWYTGTYTGGGTQAAMITWDQTAPVTLQDEWLLTPELDVSGAVSELRLEFYMLQGYTYPHDFKIYVTEDDGANWTEVFDSYGTGYPEHQWYFVTVPLSDWAGNAAPIRLGFQYYGTDADLFGIDNVSVTDEDLALGRCCTYDNPSSPVCLDNLSQAECAEHDGMWSEGLDCATNPCPLQGERLTPTDDLYTDPDDGSAHPHPVEETSLWVADFDASGHHQRIMFKWDLLEYDGETVDSAFLNIYRFLRCPGDYYTRCNLYVATEDWDEDTWNDYAHISHETSAFMSYNFGPALDWFRLDLSYIVNQWLDGSLDNYGIVIQALSGQKWSKFYSKEGTNPPYLEIYTSSGVNQCPILGQIDDQLLKTGANLSFTALADDPDGTIPSLICENLPLGASFTDNLDGTGLFDWTPAVNQTGQHVLTFCADDGELADSQQVAIQVYLCGDPNGDEAVNILDITNLITYLYQGGSAPEPIEAGDSNGNGAVNILDITHLIAYLYQGGTEPICHEN